jgi:hypothetical protein
MGRWPEMQMSRLSTIDRKMFSEKGFRRDCLKTYKRTGALKIQHEWAGPYLVGVHIVKPVETIFDVLEEVA